MRSAMLQAHQQLMDQLIAQGALWSGRVREAFRATPRHYFLERVFHYQRRQGAWREISTRSPDRNELRLLYSDRALTTRLSEPTASQPAVPISSSSQPSLMAQMLEDLHLTPGLRTLEIGTGTGYNAALLAYLVGRLVSIEIDRRVLDEAREHLRAFPDRAVELYHGDGREGCSWGAPFDRILVTAASPDLEPAWLEQLVEETGWLQVPLALAPGLAFLLQGTRRGSLFEGRLTRPAYFMPLRAESESGRETINGGLLADPTGLVTVPAPWADWAERQTDRHPRFLQALAFLAWLQGFTVSCQALPEGRTSYGVGDTTRACWLGLRHWYVTGVAGRDLGRRLWQTFLAAGGPWPTEFRLRAYPAGQVPAPALPAPGALVFPRQGPRCIQVWDLVEPRTRLAWE